MSFKGKAYTKHRKKSHFWHILATWLSVWKHSTVVDCLCDVHLDLSLRSPGTALQTDVTNGIKFK